MTIHQRESATPPYISYATFKNSLLGLADHVPDQIAPSVFSTMAGGTFSHLVQAMRYFNMIAGEKREPTELLHQMVVDEKTWKDGMRDLLDQHYSKHLPILPSGTMEGLLRAFADSYGGKPSVMRRSALFLLSAAQDVGIAVSPHITKRKPAGGARTRTRKARGNGAPTAPPAAPPNRTGSFDEALLSKIPAFDPAWDQETIQKWLDTMRTVVEIKKGGSSDA